MSSLDVGLATIATELNALKAGFAGGQAQFRTSTVTVELFTLTVTKPLTITVAFSQPDFPQLYTSTYNNTTSFLYVGNTFQRKDLYQWRMGFQLAPENYTFTCLLLSENPPTSFTLVQDP